MSLLNPLQGSRPSDLSSDRSPPPGLQPCPDTPNCIVVSRVLDHSTGDLFETVQIVLNGLKPYRLHPQPDAHRIHAVFRIPLFGFKDDLQVMIEPANPGAALHIRSSSRLGYSDLGVNRRRVQRFLNSLKSHLKHR